MTTQNPRLLSITGFIVNAVIVLNIVAAIAILVIFAVMLAIPADTMIVDDGIAPGQEANYRTAFRLVLLIAIGMAIPTHIIFTRLKSIIATVRKGNAFTTTNAVFLRAIAWGLLAINLLDLGFGAVSYWLDSMMDQYPDWSFSFTGWFAVLLLFILARIFEQGAEMRDDLAGTV